MKLQLDNCPILAVWLRPTTNNNQHTNQIHAVCYKVVGSSPSCSQIFFHSMFNLGIANGAKAGLKLRLKTPYILCLLNTWGSPLFDHMDIDLNSSELLFCFDFELFFPTLRGDNCQFPPHEVAMYALSWNRVCFQKHNIILWWFEDDEQD